MMYDGRFHGSSADVVLLVLAPPLHAFGQEKKKKIGQVGMGGSFSCRMYLQRRGLTGIITGCCDLPFHYKAERGPERGKRKAR
jgi:hypothetical protein